MRWLIALLLIPLASGGVAEGMAWLEQNAESTFVARTTTQLGDVVPATHQNPFTWPPGNPIWGHLAVHDWRNATLRESTVRTLATLAAMGAGDAYPDPVRGNLSLLSEIRSQHGHLDGGAVLSWHIWGLDAAGVAENDARRLADQAALAALQQADGSVPCSPNYGVPSVDCTAWALLALQGRNATFEARAAEYLRGEQHASGGYGEAGANLQATLWAAAALREGPVSPAGQFVQSLQASNGKFHCVSLDAPCSHAWATAEAVAYLAGGYPLQHRAPPEITGPTRVEEGAEGAWFASEEVTWHVGDDVHRGQELHLVLLEDVVLYAETESGGWAQLPVQVSPSRSPLPALPLWLAVGLLGWACHRRKQSAID
ncbi:MAG: hypothetical protein ACPHK8_04610 [Thermoplasmatota archaeon]